LPNLTTPRLPNRAEPADVPRRAQPYLAIADLCLPAMPAR